MGILGVMIIAWAGAIKFNKKIEEVIAQALLGIVLLIYMFGFFNYISLGVIVSILIIVGAFGYCMYYLFKDKEKALGAVLTYGGVAYVIYIIFFMLYSRGRDFNHTDVLSTWGIMAKKLYYNVNDLYSSSSGYPPLIPIWNFFSAKTWVCFSDSICIFGQSTMSVALLMPVFSSLDFNKALSEVKATLLLIVVPLIMVLSGMPGYDRALADGIVAALLCMYIYSLIKYFKSNGKYYFVSIIVATMSLCLAKRVGFIIACMMLFITFYAILGQKDEKKYIDIFILVGTASLAIFSWYHFSLFVLFPVVSLIVAIFLNEITNKLAKNKVDLLIVFVLIGLFVLGSCFCINIFAVKYNNVIPISRLLRKSIYLSVTSGYLEVSYTLFIIFMLGVYIYLVINNKTIIVQRIVIATIISMVTYGFLMSYIYVCLIYPNKPSIEEITPRYMIPWEIMIVYTILIFCVADNSQKALKNLMVLSVMILVISDTGAFLESIVNKHKRHDYDAFEKCGIVLNSDDKVYYVDEECESSLPYLEFYYAIFPATSNYWEALTDYLEPEVNMEQLETDIRGYYNYVYIHSYSKDFFERCGKLFTDKDEIMSQTVYRVESSGDNIKLIRVERIR